MEERDIVIDMKSGEPSKPSADQQHNFVDSESSADDFTNTRWRQQDRMDSKGSNFGSDLSDLHKPQSSVGSVYLKSIVGPDVKNKLSQMYRIESTREEQSGSYQKRLKRQKIKTIAFFVLDLGLLALCTYSLFDMYENWKKCYYNFDLWIITVCLVGGVSLIVNFYSYSLLWKMQSPGTRDPEKLISADRQLADYKRKKLQKILVYVSLVIDTGMLIQSLVGIYMVANAFQEPCNEWETRSLVIGISVASIIRVTHIVLMAIFFLCCFPCYFCSDDCFIKRRLITPGGLSKKSMSLLNSEWTWQYAPELTKSSQAKEKKEATIPTHCPLCFIYLERGQKVTYMPCQVERAIISHSIKLSAMGSTKDQGSNAGSIMSQDRANGASTSSEVDGFINLNKKDVVFDIQHVFHHECLLEWFDSNTRCPICNFSTKGSTLRTQTNENELPPLASILFKQYKRLRERTSFEDLCRSSQGSQVEMHQEFQIRHMPNATNGSDMSLSQSADERQKFLFISSEDKYSTSMKQGPSEDLPAIEEECLDGSSSNVRRSQSNFDEVICRKNSLQLRDSGSSREVNEPVWENNNN